jgi:O-methyltransferase
MKIKEYLGNKLPWPLLYFWRKLKGLKSDLPTIFNFLFHKTKTKTSFLKRLWLIFKCYQISYFVDCPHQEYEMIKAIQSILNFDPKVKGVIVEAGSYKGGSSAKISLAVSLTKRKFYVFDSFEGIPFHQERHTKNIFGGNAYFPPGSYAGSLNEVKKNISRFGAIEICEFVKGWFEETMPKFNAKIAIIYADVDLASSTKTYLTYFYPKLAKNGILFSDDGHLPWVIDIFKDDVFWLNNLHTAKPFIKNLGKEKLIEIIKK